MSEPTPAPTPTTGVIDKVVTAAMPDPNAVESAFFGISIRGWLALIVITGVVAMSLLEIPVEEPLYTVVIAVVAAYFSQKTTSK